LKFTHQGHRRCAGPSLHWYHFHLREGGPENAAWSSPAVAGKRM